MMYKCPKCQNEINIGSENKRLADVIKMKNDKISFYITTIREQEGIIQGLKITEQELNVRVDLRNSSITTLKDALREAVGLLNSMLINGNCEKEKCPQENGFPCEECIYYLPDRTKVFIKKSEGLLK